MRSNKIYLLTPVETKIIDSIYTVESLGADKRLTDAINFLEQARQLVGEYIDELMMKESKLIQYLQNETKEGKIDFKLRLNGENSFYIHPDGKDGKTLDVLF